MTAEEATSHTLRSELLAMLELDDWLDDQAIPDTRRGAPMNDWHGLAGTELVAAMQATRWYVHPDDVIGGWAICVTDRPPSSGDPVVGTVMAEEFTQEIVAAHNAALNDGNA